EDQDVATTLPLETLWQAMLTEIAESGRVSRFPATVIETDGSAQQVQVTRLGAFGAVSAGRYLEADANSGGLRVLPRQPDAHARALAEALEEAETGIRPIMLDPTGGEVLAMLEHLPDPIERLRQGRLVGYVILGVAALGLLIALQRLLALALIGSRVRRQRANPRPNPDNPLGRVMAVYEAEHQAQHPVAVDTLELKLDNAILRELPRLQRGLQTLRIMAVIAPLLGLLGTVTGLIETFQSITLSGTGDPRLMAGGISQALVTTVLGLATAIPLILLHTLCAGLSRRLILVLEQQSAGLAAAHAEAGEDHVAAA
ncbi:MAG: MotA/TolQ/ExbB proton channel family protein, partial [Thiohalocapsa sp.]